MGLTRSLVLSGLCAALLLVSACGIPRDAEDSVDRITQSRVLKAGIVEREPFTTASGGPEADVITALAQSLGAQVEWHRASESALFEALEKYELDVAVGGFTADNPWAPKLGFTRPYLRAGKKQHVIAAAPGENRLLMALERVLRAHAPAIASRVGGKPL